MECLRYDFLIFKKRMKKNSTYVIDLFTIFESLSDFLKSFSRASFSDNDLLVYTWHT